MRAFATFLCFILCSAALQAQERRQSHCIALAEATPGLEYLQQASWQDPVAEDSVQIRYIAHASFLLRTEGGLNVVTDFTGFTGAAPLIPDVVTMNHAHETHWTAHPDPAIPHVLEGWGPFGAGIEHHLDLGEMLIRNVPTDIRNMFGGVEARGNSIFVFEAAGLCIGHLGHLHHVPTPEQYAALGRLDVVMAAVDGGITLPLDQMLEVLGRLRSSVIIPMHWFSDYSLQSFLSRIGPEFDVVDEGNSELSVSLRSLPSRPTIHVLRPKYLLDGE
ncbi:MULTISPECIES: MBL fold metallo-hydrolase [unclassified Leisingera]|uniref:MBL fold metallo-hydrolase n=1 Tax=unclassified Leisingera TaxID=2614906 RepID=UPI0002FCD43E|nr:MULTISPECIES: MBL fold metallo-hydrolase [unclassified Leisingera]KIC26153.1 Zn-dependent hydrolase [Leisingera sp. ANG-S3]KIC30771.1 Zn-dependent hydrolase [Leisingera sp. ANG-M6]KIC30848.1 Zn-dependent hydrolase [Leisingera sp. ANG-S5]KIC55041.1 Zn-dependent hydrolase [Leisingera sp. ANG-S]KID08443.1 Zn-dependent hydrolase [Leisingera sp. ANG1]